MTSFGLIRMLVCVHMAFLLGAAGQNIGVGRSSCLNQPVTSISPTTITVPTYAQVHIAGYARSAPTQSEPQLTATTTIIIDTDTLDPGAPLTTGRAPAVSPSDSPARQDVLRNTLIGVLGLFLSAGSLVVAVLHSRRNVCRQRDPESATVNLELEGLGESGTQRRVDQSSENVEVSTPDVSHVSHESESGDISSVGDNASLKVQNIIFETLRSYYDVLIRTITRNSEGLLNHSPTGANAEQLPSHNSRDQALNLGSGATE
jgi:hypothetical protein